MENHVRIRDAKLVPIGNSKGVRIPKALLQKYGLKNSLLIEETESGLLLRKKEENRLSWEETYKSHGRLKKKVGTILSQPFSTDLRMMILNIKRYEIYFADLNPTIGSEIKKVRPVVIISQDEMK